MAYLPDEHPNWMDIADPDELQRVSIQLVEDPYLLENTPTTLTDLSGEEDLSQDEEDNDIEEAKVSYDEGILQDTHEIDDNDPIQDEEGLNNEEPTTPTPPSSFP
ncbi:unnamed protein product [Lactuca saligna]|uniref:Uncharacterized protein n=1 Tax=Lactuca saligna TaxID=75948 RepID=A0AA35Y7L0_LACSI|nr:unnamed protein product [Lactuca saligna]